MKTTVFKILIACSGVFALLLFSHVIFASGNHPQAGTCPKEKPYYAVCTHSLHSLEGWFSRECQSDKQTAQQDAETHAELHHKGNMRWTGIKKTR